MRKFQFKLQEWLADRISWVQYPETRVQRMVRPESPPFYRPKSSKIWLWGIVPIPFLFLVPILVPVYLVVFFVKYKEFVRNR
jgi:hypothetical protein